MYSVVADVITDDLILTIENIEHSILPMASTLNGNVLCKKVACSHYDKCIVL